jgi:hypothetical protein
LIELVSFYKETLSCSPAGNRNDPTSLLPMPDAPAEGLYIPDLLLSRYGVTDPKASFARPVRDAGAHASIQPECWRAHVATAARYQVFDSG